jgi:hypothetical protein
MTSSKNGGVPLNRVYRRLRNIHPNPDVVLQFAVHTLSVWHTPSDIGWKGTREGRCAMVWTEHHGRWRNQVRRCCHRICLNAHVSFRSLVQSFPDALLGISVAVDGQIFLTDVYSASHSPTESPPPRKLSRWGDRAVVLLIGIWLGIEGVNPICYETIKVCDSLYIFFACVRSTLTKALYTSLIVILLRWFLGGQSVLFGTLSHARDDPAATAHADYY